MNDSDAYDAVEAADAENYRDLIRPRPIAEYHEDMGTVLWWKFPIEEPPYVGSPNDLGFEMLIMTTAHTVVHGEHEPYKGDTQQRIHVGGWPGYHTHFTRIQIPREPIDAAPAPPQT